MAQNFPSLLKTSPMDPKSSVNHQEDNYKKRPHQSHHTQPAKEQRQRKDAIREGKGHITKKRTSIGNFSSETIKARRQWSDPTVDQEFNILQKLSSKNELKINTFLDK